MKKVTLNLIATNKYTLFLDDIIQSARNMFVNDCELSFIIYTDSQDIKDSHDIEKVSILYKYLIFSIYNFLLLFIILGSINILQNQYS